MEEPIVNLSNGPKGPGYYYFDETFTNLIGPFDTEETARYDLIQLASDDCGAGDPYEFWLQQFEENKTGEILSPKVTQKQINAAWYEEDQMTKERVELDHIDKLYELDGLIDGGYITFVYGSRKGNFGGWDIKKHKFKNHLILMDSGGVRQSEYEPYKSRRKERRNQYDYMRITYERVTWFREVIKTDPTVYTAEYEGYEADDLIAILYIKGIGCDQVIAQDKDLFMIPKLGPSMIDHNGIPQFYRGLKLPKYAIEPNSPASWALTQAIFGDKSDSIPRLLPSRKGYRELYSQLIKRAPSLLASYWNCMAEFGDQFLINLRLVLLPHPTLSEIDYSRPNLLFEDLCTGEYWNPDNYPDSILEHLIEDIKVTEW